MAKIWFVYLLTLYHDDIDTIYEDFLCQTLASGTLFFALSSSEQTNKNIEHLKTEQTRGLVESLDEKTLIVRIETS